MKAVVTLTRTIQIKDDPNVYLKTKNKWNYIFIEQIFIISGIFVES